MGILGSIADALPGILSQAASVGGQLILQHNLPRGSSVMGGGTGGIPPAASVPGLNPAFPVFTSPVDFQVPLPTINSGPPVVQADSGGGMIGGLIGSMMGSDGNACKVLTGPVNLFTREVSANGCVRNKVKKTFLTESPSGALYGGVVERVTPNDMKKLIRTKMNRSTRRRRCGR